jgi:homoserine kinase type II
MAVYTTVSTDDLVAWLTRYALGTVREFEPIVSGIENTNYFVTADNGRFVLTLYAPVERPLSQHCAAAGDALARMHVALGSYRGRLSNRRGPAWWRQVARAVRPFLSAEQNGLLASEIKYQSGFAKNRLPQGAIHGDLFCDNVLFDGECVSGIIDFGFAATDALAYDLAIAVNDWCSVAEGTSAGALDPILCAAMVAGYEEVRPLSAGERELWPVLLRAAALRFWLSRLHDLHLPRSGELTHAHDPSTFERILRDRVTDAAQLP